MPWNDKSNPGPWGSPPSGGSSGGSGGDGGKGGGDGPKSPWGRRDEPPTPTPKQPRRGPTPPQGPDLDELGRELGRRFSRWFRGPGGRGWRPEAVGAALAVVVGLWLLSGVYIVQPNEQAVITRFGQFVRTAESGPHVRLPWPIESHRKVAVTSLNRIDVGGGDNSDRPEESLMLTGDENIVDVDFSVTWRVANPAKYLFAIQEPNEAVKAVAETAMREVVGKTPLNDVLTGGRGRVQTQVAELMQQILDSYDSGVNVVEVQIRNSQPPQEVIEAFRDVARAAQNAEQLANEGAAYRNRVVNEARGDAARIRQNSEAYREQAVRQAEGEAARFNQLYDQYQAAPAVTRERLYLETMERVLGGSHTVIIDGQGTTAPVILPPDLFRPRGTQAPAPQPAPQGGAAR